MGGQWLPEALKPRMEERRGSSPSFAERTRPTATRSPARPQERCQIERPLAPNGLRSRADRRVERAALEHRLRRTSPGRFVLVRHLSLDLANRSHQATRSAAASIPIERALRLLPQKPPIPRLIVGRQSCPGYGTPNDSPAASVCRSGSPTNGARRAPSASPAKPSNPAGAGAEEAPAMPELGQTTSAGRPRRSLASSDPNRHRNLRRAHRPRLRGSRHHHRRRNAAAQSAPGRC